MNKNSRLHSEPKTEHQFAENQNELACQEIRDIICKYGIRKGADILADRIQRCSEKENEERRELEEKLSRLEQEKRKHQKRISAFIVAAGCIFYGIVMTGIFERIGVSNILEFMKNYILPYLVLPLAAGIMLNFFIKHTEPRHSHVKKPDEGKPDEGKPDEGKPDEGKPDERKPDERKSDEGKSEGILRWLNNFAYRFSGESGLHFLCLMVIMTVVSLAISSCKPFECAWIFFRSGYVALTDYNNHNNNKNKNKNKINETYYAPMEDGSLAEIVISDEMKTYLTESDDVLINQLERAEVTNAQRNMVMKLSKEDLCKVFFCGENQAGRYGTQEQLNENVQSMVEEYLASQLENVFDKEFDQGGAPQDIRNLISQASDEEIWRNNFSDIVNRLDLRESVAAIYPKRTLVQLVANDYQRLALLMVWYGGTQSAKIYYYGQSILNDLECLKFADNTDRLIKKRLEIIAQRYADIAYVCPDFEWAEQARRLAVAFRYVADQY